MRRMRGDLIETFKIINGFVDYGQNMFGTNTAYRTRNLNVTSHHPLRSAHRQVFFAGCRLKFTVTVT